MKSVIKEGVDQMTNPWVWYSWIKGMVIGGIVGYLFF